MAKLLEQARQAASMDGTDPREQGNRSETDKVEKENNSALSMCLGAQNCLSHL